MSVSLDSFFARLSRIGNSPLPPSAAASANTPSTSNTSANTSIATTTATAASTSVSVSDQARLRSALAELQSSTDLINAADKVAALVALSNNPSIRASVSDASKLSSSTLNLTVAQTAQSQRLQSQVINNGGIVGTGSLSLQFGTLESASKALIPNADSAKSVTIGLFDSTASGVVNAINSADVGLSSQIISDANGARIELAGNTTGRDQAFRVTVFPSTDPIDLTNDAQGLNRLSFNPSDQTANTNGLRLLQSAQDVVGAVNGFGFTSAANEVSNAIPGITLQIDGAGSARIKIQRDEDQTFTAARSLVDAFNRFRDQAKTIEAPLAAAINTDLDLAVAKAASSSDTNSRNLADIGIQRGADGGLKIDEEKLKQVFSSDPESVATVLADTAKRLGETAGKILDSSLRSTPIADVITSLRSGVSISDIERTTPPRRANASNAYAEELARQSQAVPNVQSALLAYLPTTRNLYGLSQYLSISGL